MFKSLLVSAVLAASVFTTPAAAQDCSTLNADFNGTLATGGTFALQLSGAPAKAPTLLAAGQTLGQTCFNLGLGSFCLGLAQPFSLFALGSTSTDGSVSFSVTLPPIPAALPPLTLNLQAVSLGITFGGGGPPTFGFCVSNVDAVTFN